jgi:response regulator NasT
MTPESTQDPRVLRVLVADESDEKLAGLKAVLEGLGHEVAPFAVSVGEATEIIAREDPDLAFVMVHEDDEHALALIGEAVSYASGPVLAHANGASGHDFVQRAADRGIDAYVDEITPDAVQAAIEVALRRYAERTGLEQQVEQLESALERRAAIERAKGILMERHAVDEGAAFGMLRDHARGQSRRVVDVAQAVADGHALLPRG